MPMSILQMFGKDFCYVWVHGIHPDPEKLSFFTYDVCKLFYDKWLERYRGCEKVDIGKEEGVGSISMLFGLIGASIGLFSTLV